MRVAVKWLVLGVALLQLAWIMALPPFRGVDEFDHAYRAYSVAHGQWVAEPGAATRGTGALLVVSPDLVDAARPECQRYPYTGPEDCVGTPVDGGVEVASGAGRYNPAYYVLVGAPTLVVDGTSSLYAMRFLSALLCLAMLGACLSALRRWASPPAVFGVVVGLSPVVVFSTSIVAPNGLEIMAGLALWVGLAGLALDPVSRMPHLTLCLVSGVTLLSIRSMGPLWALIILVCSLVAFERLGAVLRSMSIRREGLLAIAVGATAGITSMVWILSQRSLEIGMLDESRVTPLGERLARSFQVVPLWVFQAVAAYPSRTDPAPGVVYATYLLLLIALLVAAFVAGSRRARWGMFAATAFAFSIPVAITFSTIDKFGLAWQGRYGLPLLIGVPLIAGVSLGRGSELRNLVLASLGLVLWTIAQATGPFVVMREELRESPLAGTSSWALESSAGLVGLVAVIGSLLVVGSLIRVRGAKL